MVCLIRESSSGTINERLENALRKHGLLTQSIKEQIKLVDFFKLLKISYCRARVKSIAGDIALMNFGLNEENYHFLSYDIDAVIHAAAYVNLIYPYQALHGINVLGTRNVIDFCLANKIKPLHYIRYFFRNKS